MTRMILFLLAAMVAVFGLMPMMALTADRQTARKEDRQREIPVAATTTIYKGSMVAIDGSGYLVPASDTAGLVVVGVADEKVDNSAGANGDLNCRVLTGGTFKFAASSITQAMLGDMMYAVDDQTFDNTSANLIAVGILVKYESTTEGWILMSPFAQTVAASLDQFVVKTLDYQVTAADNGTVFAIATDAKTFTLPATAEGLRYTFINTGADGAVLLKVSPAAADAIHYITSVDNKAIQNTKATAIEGDFVSLYGDGINGWFVTAIKGTWAKEA